MKAQTMNTLRTKLTVLLVIAILVVVAISTVFLFVVQGPGPKHMGDEADVAEISFILGLLRGVRAPKATRWRGCEPPRPKACSIRKPRAC